MLVKSETIKDIQGNTQRSLTAELTILRWLRMKFVKTQSSCLRAQHEVAFPDQKNTRLGICGWLSGGVMFEGNISYSYMIFAYTYCTCLMQFNAMQSNAMPCHVMSCHVYNVT